MYMNHIRTIKYVKSQFSTQKFKPKKQKEFVNMEVEDQMMWPQAKKWPEVPDAERLHRLPF